jgi:[ribosomal protein S5]-alanine N-acetyltransferase
MAFLRPTLVHDAAPFVRANGLILRPPAFSDYVAWATLRAASRAHLVPFEPQWAHDELTRAAYRQRLRRYQRDIKEDAGYAFFIARESDGELLGGLTLSNVRRGVTQAAALGYWTGLRHTRKGCMRAALVTLLPFAFGGLRLHRIEAACLPINEASIRTLEGAHFRREGLARHYLKINGTWQDHLLYALSEEDRAR